MALIFQIDGSKIALQETFSLAGFKVGVPAFWNSFGCHETGDANTGTRNVRVQNETVERKKERDRSEKKETIR